MGSSIYEDALARPDLFCWFGISEAAFDLWLPTLPLRVHPALVVFWRRTGGGDIFESEKLFGPLIPDEGDNILKVNEVHWSHGLPRDMLIFHNGFMLSASYVDRRRHRNRLVTFKSSSYNVDRSFDTFDGWYQGTLRLEYAQRYGLPSQ